MWDSGRGIPPDQQERVFEEFCQLENLERDRAKGLGLGLAIVKRLCALLDCPITITFAPGKGSVFKVMVPLAQGGALADLSEVETPAHTLPKGLILVVDDETTIREAMRSLLSNWGFEVIAAGSGDEMLEQIATCGLLPALIISDYRLRGGENGISVIRRLQSEYNDDIPAMLITGDTAPDRLKEAQESGLPLLHKPVPNSKLRAAIGNLMSAE